MQKLKQHTPISGSLQNGSVLVGVLALAIVMAVACLGYLQLSSSAAKGEILERDDDYGFNTAETGMLLGVKWMKKGPNAALIATPAFPSTTPVVTDILPNYVINGFHPRVDIILTAARPAAAATVRSIAVPSGAVGANMGYYRSVCHNVTIGKTPFNTTSLDNAILCDGVFDFAGCGNISIPPGMSGKLHSNNALNITGSAGTNISISSSTGININNNVTVNGSVTAPSVTLGSGAAVVPGPAVEQAVPEIPVPSIDLTPWYEIALANNQVMAALPGGNPHVPYTPPGGVVWLTGTGYDLTKKVIGTVIIEGDITVNGTITSPDSGFALASVRGNILINNGFVNGLIYVKDGNYQQASNGTVIGQVIVNGTIQKVGNSDVGVYKKCIPTPPANGWDNYVDFVSGSWKDTTYVSLP